MLYLPIDDPRCRSYCWPLYTLAWAPWGHESPLEWRAQPGTGSGDANCLPCPERLTWDGASERVRVSQVTHVPRARWQDHWFSPLSCVGKATVYTFPKLCSTELCCPGGQTGVLWANKHESGGSLHPPLKRFFTPFCILKALRSYIIQSFV